MPASLLQSKTIVLYVWKCSIDKTEGSKKSHYIKNEVEHFSYGLCIASDHPSWFSAALLKIRNMFPDKRGVEKKWNDTIKETSKRWRRRSSRFIKGILTNSIPHDGLEMNNKHCQWLFLLLWVSSRLSVSICIPKTWTTNASLKSLATLALLWCLSAVAFKVQYAVIVLWITMSYLNKSVSSEVGYLI